MRVDLYSAGGGKTAEYDGSIGLDDDGVAVPLDAYAALTMQANYGYGGEGRPTLPEEGERYLRAVVLGHRHLSYSFAVLVEDEDEIPVPDARRRDVDQRGASPARSDAADSAAASSDVGSVRAAVRGRPPRRLP